MDDIEAIQRLKARYFRLMDTKDWDAWRGVFADDVVIDTTASGGSRWEGGDEFVAAMKQMLGPAVTVHQGHMPEIDLTGPDTATGIWALEDLVKFADGSDMHGYGHYHEEYVKVDGEWKIKSSTLTRLRADMTPGS